MKLKKDINAENSHLSLLIQKRIIFAVFVTLASLYFVSCSTKSQITFELIDPNGLPIKEVTITLANHNGNLSNVYQRSTSGNTVTFVDFPYGTYSVKILSKGHKEHTMESLSVKSGKIDQKINMTPVYGRGFGYDFSINFAGQNWYVLDIRDEKALIISQENIGNRLFDNDSNSWEQSEIRNYLNGDFYDSFIEKDRVSVVETTITTGNSNTQDRVFLLSVEEAKKYFADDTARATSSWWWLRSPALFSRDASDVDIGGNINMNGGDVRNDYGGIRPALWIYF